jgi:hypothetical protein
MAAPLPEPLWREVLGDAEPRRRGREAIIIITILILLGEASMVLGAMMSGDVGSFFAQLVTAWFAALLLYFIWIGQTWARWLMAPVFCVGGCWDFVWGIIGGEGLRILIGIAELIVFSYLAVSPAVYAFARNQRERISRWEVLTITGVFFLILTSIGSGIFAFSVYQNSVKADAMEFAQLTFHRVFENLDPEYLAEHSTASRKSLSPQAFINMVHGELGNVRSVGPFGGQFRTRFVPYRLELRGTAQARVIFDSGAVWIRIEVSGQERDWNVEHISWSY